MTNEKPGMNRMNRRTVLKRWAAMGGGLYFGGGFGILQKVLAEEITDAPQGMISVQGAVTVNGRPARVGSITRQGQTIRTEKGASAIYVIGKNAFLQRESSTVHFGFQAAKDFMRVVMGRVLAVFEPGNKRIMIPDAVIGIRGTACYFGVETEGTYVTQVATYQATKTA